MELFSISSPISFDEQIRDYLDSWFFDFWLFRFYGYNLQNELQHDDFWNVFFTIDLSLSDRVASLNARITKCLLHICAVMLKRYSTYLCMYVVTYRGRRCHIRTLASAWGCLMIFDITETFATLSSGATGP